MKQITLFAVLVFLAVASPAYAEIQLNVISYNPDTQRARILIANTGTKDYTDLTFALGDMRPMEFKGSLLKAGTAITLPKIVPTGTYKVTVTTAEGDIFTQELLFTPSGKQILEETPGVQPQGTGSTTPQQPLLPETGGTGGDQEGSSSGFFLVILLLLVLGLVAAGYFYLRNHPQTMQKFLAMFKKTKPAQGVTPRQPVGPYAAQQTRYRQYPPRMPPRMGGTPPMRGRR